MNTIIRSTDQIQCSNDQAGHGGGDSRVGGSWGGVSMGNDSRVGGSRSGDSMCIYCGLKIGR